MGKHINRYAQRRRRRKQFLTLRVQRRSRSRVGLVLVVGVACAVLVVVVICVVVLHRQANAGLSAAELLPHGGDVHLSAKHFQDGQARYYRYTVAAGREIRFFVIQTSDGVVRTAFDGCDACYRDRRGYRQAGGAMVCNSCGRTFPSAGIGVVRGGCNPSPLERVVESGQVLLKASDLARGAAYF